MAEGGRLRVIVSVMGLPHQLSWASYSLGGGRVCSKMATVPILSEVVGASRGSRVRLVLVAPHSLIQLADGWEGLLREGNPGALTEGVERGAAAAVADSLAEVAEWIRGSSPDLADELSSLARRANDPGCSWIDVRVVQVRGSFPLPSESETFVVRFSGDPAHAFVETYRALKRARASEGADDLEIFVDLSHGWNFLSFLAYLGVAAFRDAHMPEVRINVRSSEPYSPLAKCKDKELRAPHEEGRGPRLQVEGGHSLGLMDVEPAASTLRLVRDAARLRAIPHLSLKFRDLVDAYRRALDEFGDGSNEAVALAKAAALLRKVSCGLHSGMIPYLHWSLLALGEELDGIRRVIRKIEGELDSGAYAEGEVRPRDGGYEISYPRRPPLSYVLLDVIARELESVYKRFETSLLDGRVRYAVFPGFLDDLLNLYQDLGLETNATMLEVELGIADARDSDPRVRGAVDSLNFLLRRKGERRGIAAGYLIPWIRKLGEEGLKSVEAQLELLGEGAGERLARVPLYSLHFVRRSAEGRLREILPNISLDSPKSLFSNAGVVESRLGEIVDALWSEDLRGNRMVRNLWLALRLISGERVEADQVGDVIRNMLAHVGLQHYTLSAVLVDWDPSGREIRDFRIAYLADLFGALDRMAAETAAGRLAEEGLSDLVDRLSGDVGRPVLGCLCDLRPGGS